MDDRSTFRGPTPSDRLEFLRPHVTLVALTLLAAIPIILAALLVPRPLVLPALSVVAIGVSGLTALAAWAFRAQRSTEHVSLWDISGALALIGCAAATLSKPESVLQLVGVP
jgi:hypothetical protein